MKEFDENITISTRRLILRFLKEEDRSAIFRNINHDPEVLKYYVDSYKEKEEDLSLSRIIEKYRAEKMYFLAIVLKENGEVIGNIFQINRPDKVMNTVEVGFALGRPYWDQGYMSEALNAMIRLLFSSGVHKVRACHIEENAASGEVMKKCGMHYEGKRIDDLYYHGRYWDTLNYYILEDE